MQRFLFHALYYTSREGLSASLHVQNDNENEIEVRDNTNPPPNPPTLALLRHAGQAPPYIHLPLAPSPPADDSATGRATAAVAGGGFGRAMAGSWTQVHVFKRAPDSKTSR